LRADDGTAATYTATWVENRIPVAKTDCGGVTYRNVFSADTKALTMDVTFPEWGHAVLATTTHLVVYPSSKNGSSPPVCDEAKGGTFTFEFTNGPVKQVMSGTWSSSAKGRLVFDATKASPGASPSEKPA
jgi:hypothetical protein